MEQISDNLNLEPIKYVGVVGSGAYRRKDIVISKLDEAWINVKYMVIVSGRSPRNKEDNVDIWAEEYARDNCDEDPIIYKPSAFTRDAFFERNKKIADKSDILFVFINKGQYKSGAWNTVKWFLIKQRGKAFRYLNVFDENGNEWYKLPNWTKKYMIKNL